ncbi:MAG: UDP-N-acetylmuramoyl-L-alanine---L-glutamate ligase [Solirubrobacteraceae bacterium]|nr:UDP-N-acetylmuramoyl-L-alanine---L-glutamate ligase [Solirubrobacteraceae bacterium]
MRFSELDGLAVGVWGLGREVRSFVAKLAEHLPRARISVVVREDPEEDASDLERGGAQVVRADEAVAALSRCDVIVRSPGVSIHRRELVELARADIRTATPTGLWLSERGGRRVIGVTGTKGKSTTATIIAHLAATAGHRVHLAGNIGRPALELLDVPAADWAVIELSSYQIADLRCGPEVAVMTNLYKDHVNWHGSDPVYRAEKLRLLALPRVATCVLPAGNADIAAADHGEARVMLYDVAGAWHVTPEGINDGARLRIPFSALPLRGPHNAVNVCAALTAIQAAGLSLPALPDGLTALQPLPHRLETVQSTHGVEWVDDSISTTPESTIAALASFPDRRVILLGGGQDRDQDYSELATIAVDRRLLLLGLPTTGSRLVSAARAAGVRAERAVEVADMAEAVALAHRLARPGTIVLLSPAAPSYNAYRNFEERGAHFRALARLDHPPQLDPA